VGVVAGVRVVARCRAAAASGYGAGREQRREKERRCDADAKSLGHARPLATRVPRARPPRRALRREGAVRPTRRGMCHSESTAAAGALHPAAIMLRTALALCTCALALLGCNP